jgi:DNA mismatch endonuclease (patch repair protein)
LADVVDAATRSRMMSGIRGKNTKPELMIRKALHARGFRYRLHCDLPGKPDICLPKYRAVIFVHGCFWHGHECHLFKKPTTRTDFWLGKIARNQQVDATAHERLRIDGWRVATVWECALKGRTRLNFDEAIDTLSAWLPTDSPELTVRGRDDASDEPA